MKVVSLWRYPVKSMMGDELNPCHVTEKGVLGDRAYGIIDIETGKLANAKNPKKWPKMFYYRATYTEDVHSPNEIPPVRITMPDGNTVLSEEPNVNERLSSSFNRNVVLGSPSQESVQFEGYVPEAIKELDNRGSIFSRTAPKGTFFDIGLIHIITTNTIEKLQQLTPSSRIEPRRFRPNIILDVPGQKGFVEEEWVGCTISIDSDVQLKIVQPTKRCVMTTLAQGDLPNDLNVLRTLAQQNNGVFGVYAEVIQAGRITVGDHVDIISK